MIGPGQKRKQDDLDRFVGYAIAWGVLIGAVFLAGWLFGDVLNHGGL